MIFPESETALARLGRGLRALRIERGDRQVDFAARLGVSIPTLRKMETGDPTVAIGTWIDALAVLGRLDALPDILAPGKSLFEEWERRQTPPKRQRAPRK